MLRPSLLKVSGANAGYPDSGRRREPGEEVSSGEEDDGGGGGNEEGGSDDYDCASFHGCSPCRLSPEAK